MALPYYSVGTATLTQGSAAMVGQGTLWAVNIRPGDTVVSYSGQTAIVGSVNSDTSITLTRAYRGTSQTAAAYEIAYAPADAGVAVDVAAVLNAIRSSAMVGLSGVAPAARKLPYFDAASAAALTGLSDFMRTVLDDADATAALATLGADDASKLTKGTLADARLRSTLGASNGSDIPDNNYNNATSAGWYNGPGSSAVNGPTDGAEFGPLLVIVRFTNVAQIAIAHTTSGGSRPVAWMRAGNTSTNAWSSWERILLNRNIIGTVSMSSGAPNGSLFERGSNANGQYERKADGSQTCFCAIEDSAGEYTLGSGGLFLRTSPLIWTFPAGFINAPDLILGSVYRDDNRGSGVHVRTVTSTNVTVVPWSSVSLGAFYKVVRLEVRGRWA